MVSFGLRQRMHHVTFYFIILLAITTLGPLQFGFHLAELNAPQDVITCKKEAIDTKAKRTVTNSWHSLRAGPDSDTSHDCIPMDNTGFATVSAMFTVGGLIGSLASGPFASKYGRLPTMRITALVFWLGSSLETSAQHVVWLGAGRLVSGVGAGAATVVVPLYISEISPPKERGLFGAMTQISTNVGILLSQTLGYFLSHGGAWRGILGAGAAVALVQAFGLCFVPESPAWLAANGGDSKALRILQRIRGGMYDTSEETAAWHGEAVNSEQEALLARPQAEENPPAQRQNAQAEVKHLSFFQVVKDPLYRPAIIAVVGVMCAQQFNGINAIVMYSVSLLEDVLPMSSSLLTILFSVVNFLATVACSPLPDRLGRKVCFMISIVGQGASSLVLALSIRFEVKILSAVAVLTFVAFFAVGLGPVPFILASELVGQEAVGATQSWSLASNYTATFLVAQLFPIINAALNKALGGAGWVFFIFAAFAVLFAIFVAWRVPETKGKKDADEVWGRQRRLD